MTDSVWFPHTRLGRAPIRHPLPNDHPVARLGFRIMELWIARWPARVVSWRISRDAYEQAWATATTDGANSIAINVDLKAGLSATTPVIERTKILGLPFVIDDELPPNSLIAVYDDQ